GRVGEGGRPRSVGYARHWPDRQFALPHTRGTAATAAHRNGLHRDTGRSEPVRRDRIDSRPRVGRGNVLSHRYLVRADRTRFGGTIVGQSYAAWGGAGRLDRLPSAS